jgi:FAD/FMN-containing dehydrogenase
MNFLDEEGQDRVRAAYGPEKYGRLVALKDAWDPGNLFRRNQNIRPSG